MSLLNRTVSPVMFWAVTASFVAGPLALPAIAANLGAASDYNVFVFGDAHQKWTDAEGSIAVGGNATYESFAARMDLNAPLPTLPTSGQHALVVGNNLNFTHGSANGDVTVGGIANLNHVNVAGRVTQGAQLGDFFSQAEQELKALSASLQALPPTGVGTDAYHNWIFNASSGFNVFDLEASTWGQATSFYLNAPSDATVVFNVSGSGVTVTNHEMFLNGGIENRRILFNFHNANSITFDNYGLQGSVLAPYATVQGHWGQVNGNLIAENLFNQVLAAGITPNTMQSNNASFAGELPFGAALPEPNATVPTPALLPGLIGFATAMRKRYKQGSVEA